MSQDEKQMLEGITGEYLAPDPGRIVDQKIVKLIVAKTLPWLQGPEVLEMGYGDGQWTDTIIEKFGHSNLVDASETLIKEAAEKYGDRLNAHISLFEDFAPPIQYNNIISSFVLEHVEDPVDVMKKAAQWLAPGGHLIVIVPHADSFHRRLGVHLGMLKNTTERNATDEQMGHRRVYTIEAMENDIRSAGLKIVDQKGLFVKLLSQAQMTGFSDDVLNGLMELSEEVPMEFSTSIAFDCVKS